MLSKGLLLAVDANSLLHRAYHAYPPSLTTTDGHPVNAVYGFTSMFLDALLTFKPEYVFCAFDTPKPTFRHAQYVGYKANRKETDSELVDQIPYVFQVLESLNVPIFKIEGYEADDILGTIAHKVIAERLLEVSQVRILSGDRDLFQLVNEKVHVILPQGSFRNLEVYTEQKVFERMGVTPAQITELKGLMGDASDNIPGVKGIGPKTASTLLSTHGTIEALYRNLDTVAATNKRVAELLVQGHESAVMSKELATIALDTPVTFVPTAAETKIFEPNTVAQLFSTLQFKSLFPKLKKFIEVTGNALSAVHKPISQEKSTPRMADAVIFTDSPGTWEVISLQGMSLQDRLEYVGSITEKAICIYSQEKLYVITNSMVAPIRDEKCLFFGFFEFLSNATEIGNITAVQVKPIEQVLDIELLSYALQTGRNNYSLQEDCTEAGLGLLDYVLEQERDAVENVIKRRVLRELQRAEEYEVLPRVGDMWAQLQKSIETLPLSIAQYEDISAGLGVALMRHRGITIDLRKVKETAADYRDLIANLEREIFDLVGFEFNIKSPRQLATVLFDTLQLPHGRKTKTGYSTDDEVLQSLLKAHPAVEKIVGYRQLTKLVSTYMEPYVILAQKGGSIPPTDTQMSMFGTEDANQETEVQEKLRVHSTFTITSTSSGRLSSSNPNLQNLPVRTDAGKKIRQFFIPSEGKKLVSIDYSQIDLRVLAHISGDDALVSAFKNNEDIHRSTAAKVFHVPFEHVTDQQRRFSKAINFGLVYGMSAFGLSQSLGIDVAEASKFIEEYFIQFPGVKRYMNDTMLFAKEYGYVVSLLGRRRYIAGIGSNIRVRAAAAEREAINMPIQGGADDIMRLALGKLTQLPEVLSGEMPLVLQVHDEFVFEMTDNVQYIEEKILKIRGIMENVLQLSVPLKADGEVGSTLDFS